MKRAALFVAVVVAASSGACGSKDDADRTVRQAILRTSDATRRFTYEERTAARRVKVTGIVEDDYRYKAALLVGDRPVFEEVSADDVLASRILDPTGLPLLIRAGTDPASNDPGLAALRRQDWVADDEGAPDLTPSADGVRRIGQDPVIDAMTVLGYISGIAEGPMKLFNPNALDYDKKEDPFPQPDRSKGIQRYDSTPTGLPRLQDIQGTKGRRILPSTDTFRKMAVYTKGGRVIEIREDVHVINRIRELATHNYFNLPAGLSPAQLAAHDLDGFNRLHKEQGEGAIRERTMTVRFTSMGARVSVELPSDSVKASLSVLRNRGKLGAVQPTAAVGTVGAPTETTTPEP